MVGYMLDADWFGNAVVSILGFFNYGIYSLVRITCSLIVNIANTTFNDSLLGNFQTRIYIVLAIYMLFKLAFSLLSSIVNPDALLDKEKGMQKIITRTIIALIMLIMFPTIFNYAMEWQNDIVEFIPRIIIGRQVNLDDDSIGDEGEKIAASALSAFITPNEDCSDFSPDDVASPESYIDTSSLSSAINAASQKCDATKKEFKYEFSGIVSLVVGIVLVFILVTYCIDIGIRVLKLGILKILSPIPIISYIDPKSEKNGAFGNWLKECISTYVELFIKMGILHFTLFILGNLSDSSVSIFKYPENATISKPFIILVLIIASFFFMGKAAQFICNIIGIKYDKGSGGVLGKALGIAGGALLGAGVGAAGAMLAGGGMHGIASAALQGIGTGAGGKPLGSFNKGRDIAAQIKTGDPNAKHKNWLTKRANAINKNRAKSLGFTETPYDANGDPILDENGKQILGTVDQAKNTMYAAKNEMNNAAAMRDRFNSGHLSEADRQLMEQLRNSEGYEGMDDGQMLDKYYNATVSNAGKAEKYYSDAKQYATILGLETSKPMGKEFRKDKPFEPNKYQAIRNGLKPSADAQKEPEKKPEPLPAYNTETKSGILINPSPDMEKKIMDEARKNGQIR